MQAHGRPHPELRGYGRTRRLRARGDRQASPTDQLHGLAGGVGIGADTHQAAHPGLGRFRQHREQLDALGPVVVLDMAVRVDPAGEANPTRATTTLTRFVGGTTAAPSPPGRRRDSRPRRPRRAGAGRRGAPRDPRRRQISALVSGIAGDTRSATIRNASRALPSTPDTAGPGSDFHGSVVSSSAFVSRMSRHVASRATCGCPSFHAAVASSTTPALTAPSRLSGSGAGPIPPHFDPTTVATRAMQVPEVVGQIGVVPGRDPFIGEVAVGRRTVCRAAGSSARRRPRSRR